MVAIGKEIIPNIFKSSQDNKHITLALLYFKQQIRILMKNVKDGNSVGGYNLQ